MAIRVCDELQAKALTRNVKGEDWGILLRWNDPDGMSHVWPMPMELLHGEASALSQALSSRGLRIRTGQGKKLKEYLQVAEPGARVRCVDRVGWHGGVYCTPDGTIGATAGERIVFQGSASIASEHGRAGTLERWRDTVAAPAAGNSRLTFAISAALAGPLLDLVGHESGGFHLLGDSSTGKSTALRMAASVWGKPDGYIRQWRATANGLEAVASLHNDGLLILDEIGQCDPKQAGEVAYMLGNGKGKSRASRSGGAREAASWQLLFLSSGEVSLASLLERDGRKANAGQELRLVNIAADAGAGLGAFEDLHGSDSPSRFADALKEASATCYGAVGWAWLKCLVKDRAALSKNLPILVKQFTNEVVPSGASGQVDRVAARFGLVAAAGEVATFIGLTGWQKGEAEAGAKACFRSWLEENGTGNREDSAIVDAVVLFIEKHGSSRFQKLESPEDRILNRAGYCREERGAKQYLITPDVFRSDVVAGFDHRHAARVLLNRGMLIPDGVHTTKVFRVPGDGSKRMYCVTLRQEVAA